MLDQIGVSSLDALIDEAIPSSIRLSQPLDLPPAESESQYLTRLKDIARKNKVFRSFIGLGYYDTLTPSVIRRCLFENPGWYTPYTPYQAEIAQGRLESLLNFQTMVTDLTGMAVANASLLDEATAAGEAMTLFHRVQTRKLGDDAGVFLVSDGCFPQTIEVLRSRAEPLGIELRIGPIDQMTFDARVFGALVQYPDETGLVSDLRGFISQAHEAGALVAVATDLLALAVITPPGEMGADVVFGNSQRFGVPIGFGGPHAAFFATKDDYVRHLPGRIIGVSIDAQGKSAYRMALQTREQHIRREKATSNICTAQALLANMAAMYAVYHGPAGIRAIAERVHGLARLLDGALGELGYTQQNHAYFDTLRITAPADALKTIRGKAVAAGLNFRYVGDAAVSIALDETATLEDVHAIVGVFATAAGRQPAQAARRLGTGRRTHGARVASPHHAVSDPSRVQRASFRNGNDALHPRPRAQGHRPRHLDDPARLLHHEAQRRKRDVSGLVGRVFAHPSVCAGQPGRRLRADLPRAGTSALCDYRTRRHLIAAELGCAG